MNQLDPARPLALKSNGSGEDLSPAQLESITKVRAQLLEKCGPEWRAQNCYAEMEDYCGDPDTIRRFLVARNWNETKALNQLAGMQAFRLEEKPWTRRFCESPGCAKNPFAMNLRMVGLDKVNRPVTYTGFAQANDRWNVKLNVTHMRLLLFAAENILIRLRRTGKSVNADQIQWVWVIDFVGFGMWDQNPNSAVETGRLMAQFPEMLSCCVLLDAPRLFSATWSLVSAVLDERVRAKVVFVDLDKFTQVMEPRLGEEMARWLYEEAVEAREDAKRKDKTNLRRYWVAPGDGKHDPRGVPSYVNSDLYIKTPGDAWQETQ